MEVLELIPTEVKVKDGLDRFRKDLGEINKLVESISRYGQLQPIVITKNKELICGGRRLAACLISGVKVKAIYNDSIEKLELREMELEENIQRKEFTPAEEVLAISEIHKIKQEIYGEATPGAKNSGWTLDKTAEIIGKTRGNVIESLQLAEAVKAYPELKKAKTKTEIKNSIRAISRVKETLEGIKKYEKESDLYKLYHRDAKDLLKELPDGKFNCFLTDPPYGINIENSMKSFENKNGLNCSGITFNDSFKEMEIGIDTLAKELFRVTTETAQGYIFTCPEHFYMIREVFLNYGWFAYIKPIIWIKGSTGQSVQHTMYPSSCYETILFLRKKDSRLVLEGRPDWIQCNHVTGVNKIHMTEKPVQLLMELLSRISFPGQTMLDPFCGSGSSIEAGIRSKLKVTACDKLFECYATAKKRVEEFLEKGNFNET